MWSGSPGSRAVLCATHRTSVAVKPALSVEEFIPTVKASAGATANAPSRRARERPNHVRATRRQNHRIRWSAYRQRHPEKPRFRSLGGGTADPINADHFGHLQRTRGGRPTRTVGGSASLELTRALRTSRHRFAGDRFRIATQIEAVEHLRPDGLRCRPDCAATLRCC